jgi:hypothetical protein
VLIRAVIVSSLGVGTAAALCRVQLPIKKDPISSTKDVLSHLTFFILLFMTLSSRADKPIYTGGPSTQETQPVDSRR